MEIIIIEWIEIMTGDFQKIRICRKHQLVIEDNEVLKLKQRQNMEHSNNNEEVLVLMWKELEIRIWKDKLGIRKMWSLHRKQESQVLLLQNNIRMDLEEQINCRVTTFKWSMNQASKVLSKNLQVAFIQKAKPKTIPKNVNNVVSTLFKQCLIMTWNGLVVNMKTVENGIIFTAWMLLLQSFKESRITKKNGFVNLNVNRHTN